MAILLACGGDLVLDEYNTRFDESGKPKYSEVLQELAEKFAGGESERYLSHIFRQSVQRADETVDA